MPGLAKILPTLLLWAGPDVAGAPPPELESLVQEARQIQRADLELWARLAFRRQVTRERFDDGGRVIERQELEFRVRPSPQGFDEELLRIDGRTPTRAEVREHRAAGRFNRRYQMALYGEAPRYDRGDFSLAQLLRRRDYVYGGREEVAGIACHRLDFRAQPEVAGGAVEERMAAATEGSLWLAEESLHTVRTVTRMARPVAVVRGILRVEQVAIRVETAAYGDHRLPSLIEVRSDLVIAGKPVHKRNLFRYSELSAPIAEGPAAEGNGPGGRAATPRGDSRCLAATVQGDVSWQNPQSSR